MSVGAGEIKRKAVHIGMAGFALCLRFLDWRGAALAALGALVFNLFVLPRLGGAALDREDDRKRGYSVGILLYPVVVLLLVAFFPLRLEIVAAGWGFLAFGDGFATLAGKAWGRARLPWNDGKSWAGLLTYVVAGGLGGALLYTFVAKHPVSALEIAAILAAAVVGAGVESLPSELDDNLVAPLVAAGALGALLQTLGGWDLVTTAGWQRGALIALGVNLAVSLSMGAARLVRPSGVWSGFLFGTVILAFGGWGAYALLWVFFAGGTLATRFGKRRKEAMGKAEESGGRRGAPNVFANVSVAAFCAVVAAVAGRPDFALAAAAALATALMDTVGTEIGQAIKSPTVLLPDLRRVPPGTDGAVSIAGTLAGLLAGALLAWAGVAAGVVTTFGAGIVVAAAFVGTVVESLLGRAGAPWRVTNGHVLNFYNTLAGAFTALTLHRLLA